MLHTKKTQPPSPSTTFFDSTRPIKCQPHWILFFLDILWCHAHPPPPSACYIFFLRFFFFTFSQLLSQIFLSVCKVNSFSCCHIQLHVHEEALRHTRTRTHTYACMHACMSTYVLTSFKLLT